MPKKQKKNRRQTKKTPKSLDDKTPKRTLSQKRTFIHQVFHNFKETLIGSKREKTDDDTQSTISIYNTAEEKVSMTGLTKSAQERSKIGGVIRRISFGFSEVKLEDLSAWAKILTGEMTTEKEKELTIMEIEKIFEKTKDGIELLIIRRLLIEFGVSSSRIPIAKRLEEVLTKVGQADNRQLEKVMTVLETKEKTAPPDPIHKTPKPSPSSQTFRITVKTPEKIETTAVTAPPVPPISSFSSSRPPPPPPPPPFSMISQRSISTIEKKQTTSIAVSTRRPVNFNSINETLKNCLTTETKQMLETWFCETPKTMAKQKKQERHDLLSSQRRLLLELPLRKMGRKIEEVFDDIETGRMRKMNEIMGSLMSISWPTEDEMKIFKEKKPEELKGLPERFIWEAAHRPLVRKKLELMAAESDQLEQLARLKKRISGWYEVVCSLKNPIIDSILQKITLWINFLNQGSFINPIDLVSLRDVGYVLDKKTTAKDKETKTLGQLLMKEIKVEKKEMVELLKKLEVKESDKMDDLIKEMSDIEAEMNKMKTIDEKIVKEFEHFLSKYGKTMNELKELVKKVKKEEENVKKRLKEEPTKSMEAIIKDAQSAMEGIIRNM